MKPMKSIVDDLEEALEDQNIDLHHALGLIESHFDERDDLSPEAIDSVVRKGRKNEHEAKDILGMVRGRSKVDRVYATYGDDAFGLADIIAVGPDSRPLIVQVKTNEFAPEDRKRYKNQAHRVLNLELVDFEVWVRIDYEGWERYWLTDEWELIDELPLDTEAAAEELR